MQERHYQPKLIEKIKAALPGAMVLKGDTRFRQGCPDLIVLYGDKWAALEVKKSPSASKQPNQDYYVEKLNEMSYAAVVHPGNEKDVLNALQRSLQAERCPRIPEPE